MSELNVHAFIPVSEANGPGKRSVLWVQGCLFDCDGCFNQPARSFIPFNPMNVEQIMSQIPLGSVEGITISGGEPFYQAEMIAELCESARQEGLSIMLYTGYTLEQIQRSEEPHFRRLLNCVDILVDGLYIEELPPNTLWAGSGNQQVHFLTDLYSDYKEQIASGDRLEEIHINAEGEISLTGF